jgi:diacylglycerol kinase family enzyme
MRIILIHNPKAGRGKHYKKELMAALADAGHHAIYQSTKDARRTGRKVQATSKSP